MHERQQELQKLTQYTDSWAVTQLVSEYYRFESSIGLYLAESDDMTIDDLLLRFEIMFSQSDLLKEGNLAYYIKNNKYYYKVADQLESILNYLDQHLKDMSRTDLKTYLEAMHTLDAPLSSLSSTALTNDSNIVQNTNLKIKHLYYIYSTISLLLIVLSAILGIMTIYQNKNILKAHQQVKKLAEELQISKEKLQIQNARLEYDVYHDSLTDMKNRSFFWKNIESVIMAAKKTNDSVTVMLFDLDRFKEVNDSLGHDAGDLLLRQISKRIDGMNLTADILYRLGGDEFALLSCGLTESESVSRAKDIRDCISQPYTIHNTIVNISTCVGIVVSQTERRSDYLYKFADLALYEAKKEGASQIKVFRQHMLQRLKDSRTLEHDLAMALINKEFVVYYQPIVDSFSGDIYGYEALVRWKHPVRGLLAPDIFIPVAEKTWMINELGEIVLELACREAASWAIPARISVNVSPVQLSNKAFRGTVLSILKETGLSPDRLELEVTESSIFTDSDIPRNILTQLRALGVKVSIDDFGSGYSSLSRLSKFAFDKIKIDKSFVRSISTQSDALNIVKLIIGMAKCLNMQTVAEGVETKEQLACLQSLGCDLVQGYLFGKPQPLVDEKIRND